MSNLWANLTYRWSLLGERARAALVLGIVGLAVLTVVGAAALAGGGEEAAAPTTAPPTTLSPPATTVPPPTTTPTTLPPPTTTTLPPLPPVTLADAPDEQFTAIVTDAYRLAAGEPRPDARVVGGLFDHLVASGAGTSPSGLTGTAHTATLASGARVGVAVVGDDALLLVDDGAGWLGVGARLPSAGVPAWLGPEPRHVLIIGSDARWNQNVFGQRSDSLHVLSASVSRGTASIVGIPRDSWVRSPSGGNRKITDIMPGAGPDGTFATVAGLSGLPLEGWIITGFLGFEIMVDDVGGVIVDLPRRVRGGLPGFPNFPEGEQTLSGKNALLLARIRKTLPRGDFDRSFNHGVIMQGALRQIQSRGIADLPALLAILTKSAHTSLSAEQLLTLGALAYELDPASVTNLVLPGGAGSVGAASVVFLSRSGSAAVWADVADGALDG